MVKRIWVAGALMLIALATAPVAAQTGGSALPAGFARVSSLGADIREDMRYAGPRNFTGRRVPGYEAGECWLLEDVARRLALVAGTLKRQGWRLVVHDCYRPMRAVNAFLAWTRAPDDPKAKAEYYPAVEKSRLVALGYIGAKSAHAQGLAVDASAERLDGGAIDFGTPYDFFDPGAATASRAVSQEAQANRRKLAAAFAAHGLRNYAREWWHFSSAATGTASPPPMLDAPITTR